MGGGTPSTDIGPGLGAFVAFFALALLLWLLMRNMNGRMRRMAYTERERVARLEARDAEARGRTATTGATATTGTTTDSGDEPVSDGDPATDPPPRGDDDEHDQSGAHNR